MVVPLLKVSGDSVEVAGGVADASSAGTAKLAALLLEIVGLRNGVSEPEVGLITHAHS
jgi:hypothetical protein